MADHWKKLVAVGFLVFLALWVAGVIRSFTLSEPEPLTISAPASFESGPYRGSTETLRMANNLAQIKLHLAPLPQILDQEEVNEIRVYDKTAQIATGTTVFADDEARIRKAITTHKAVIFSEKASGIAPERFLVLGISVHPEKFDALLNELTSVGQIRAIDVQRQDRTGEFRRFHAQRQSLKKYHQDIQKLHDPSKLSVDEQIKLGQKIQDLKKDLLSLDAQLSDFLVKESSYNLFVTLQEHLPGSRHDRSFTLVRRLVSGFLWAIGWWLLAALGAGLLIGTFVSVQTLKAPAPSTASAAPAPREVGSPHLPQDEGGAAGGSGGT